MPADPIHVPMRIAFYCNLMGWPKKSAGGVRQWVLALANGLVERGYDVDVLTEAPAEQFRDEARLDVRVGRVVLGKRGWRATRRLHQYLEAHPDVRLVSALNDFNIRAARVKPHFGARVQVMLTQHENLSGDGVWRKKLKYWRLGRAVRRLFPQADSVVCVSHGVAVDLRERFQVPADLLHPIYNPAFSESFVYSGQGEVDHPWLRDKTAPVIIAVGRLHPVKGFDDLLRAFALLLKQRDARLIILGDGRSRAELEALVQALGLRSKVALAGRVDNVPAWMAHSDLFALSSRSEGFGNALVEALAAGLRIVSTRCPSGPAEILENGRWGELVPVGDAQSFAAAMARQLDAPPADREALVRRARDFSLDAALEHYLRLWMQPSRD